MLILHEVIIGIWWLFWYQSLIEMKYKSNICSSSWMKINFHEIIYVFEIVKKKLEFEMVQYENLLIHKIKSNKMETINLLFIWNDFNLLNSLRNENHNILIVFPLRFQPLHSNLSFRQLSIKILNTDVHEWYVWVCVCVEHRCNITIYH